MQLHAYLYDCIKNPLDTKGAQNEHKIICLNMLYGSDVIILTFFVDTLIKIITTAELTKVYKGTSFNVRLKRNVPTIYNILNFAEQVLISADSKYANCNVTHFLCKRNEILG